MEEQIQGSKYQEDCISGGAKRLRRKLEGWRPIFTLKRRMVRLGMLKNGATIEQMFLARGVLQGGRK
jgi:hypothetical protein